MEVHTKKKYKGKTVSQLIKVATRYFNAYIRKRDRQGEHFTCISCQQIKSADQMDAGHFFPAGHHPSVRFDERNVHGQCRRCNYFLHGNLAQYKDNLKRKIGGTELQRLRDKVDAEKRYGFKWDKFYLIDVIERYKHEKTNA